MILNKKLKIVISLLAIAVLAGGIVWAYQHHYADARMVVSEKSIEKQGSKEMPYERVVRGIVPHKALYQMEIVKIHAGSPINDLTGEMFFKWEDNCEAWSTDHRFTIDYFYTDRPSVSVTSHFVAWEDKRGDRIQFVSEGYTDGILDEKTRGQSHRLNDRTGVVDYQEPQGLNFDLGKNFFFPAQHTVATIHNALQGKSFFNAVMFDGTDQEGPSEVNVFIDQKSETKKLDADFANNPAVDASLLNGKSWDMRLAFFPEQGEGSDLSTPSYEMKVRLHENGVVSDIVVEYDNFSVRQKLVALSALPVAKCNNNEAL